MNNKITKEFYINEIENILNNKIFSNLNSIFEGKINDRFFYLITYETIYKAWDFQQKRVNISYINSPIWKSSLKYIKEFYDFLKEV